MLRLGPSMDHIPGGITRVRRQIFRRRGHPDSWPESRARSTAIRWRRARKKARLPLKRKRAVEPQPLKLILRLLLRRDAEELPGVGALHLRADGEAGHINKLMLFRIGAVHKARAAIDGGAKG